MDIISYILSRKYCDNSIIGLGAIRGANCTISDIVHQDGINTVTFKWTGTDGTEKTRDMVVYDGTPIYVWESGNTYHYGDLAIYESQFYRCIVENNDATFDSTKWNEIGSPDGNYDIVQSVNLLPARFTAADRKLYYVIDENCFYLWNGTAWVKTISNKIADLDDVNLDDLTEGDVLVWDSVNEKWVNKAKFDEYKTTFVGTQAQWDALTPAQQDVYKIINITDDGEVINLGVYLEKKAVLPTANADNVGTTYIYTGASNANYKKGACYECQHIGQTYTWVQVSVSKDDFDALGTASAKNYTSNVRPNNTDLVESQAVYSAINNALASIYVPRGDLSCAELTSDLLIPANVGNVYTMSDSGTTSALFINGAGHPIATNDNVGIIKAGENSIMFNLMGNAFDLHDYQTKELETPITIDGTQATEVEGALGGLNGAVDKRVTYEYNGKMGAKNLLKYPYAQILPKTIGGITFSDEGEGKIGISSGTIQSYASYDFYNENSKLILPVGDYIVSCNSSEAFFENGQYFFISYKETPSIAGVPLATCRIGNSKASFSITQEMYNSLVEGQGYLLVRLTYEKDTTINNNVVFKAMLRLADDQDDTWQPYAMTNKELTDKVNEIESETPYVTPEMFGAVGDGVTDDTEAIIKVLAYDNIIGNGVYAISSPIYAQINSHVNMSLSLKAIDTMDYVLWLDAKGSAWNQLVNGEFNISIDCNLLASDGLRIDRFSGSNVKVKVKNFTNNALSVRHTPNTACGGNYIQLDASNLETATTVSPNAVGLCCGQDDIYYVDCANVKTAVKLRYGGNKFEVLHAWSSTEDWFLNSVMLDIIVDDKNMFDTFISDTIQVLFKMDNSQVTRYPQIATNNSMIYNNTNVTSLPIYVWWLKDTSPFVSSNIYGFKIYRNHEYNQISWASGSVPNILVGDTPVVTDVKNTVLGNRCSVFNLNGLQFNSLNVDLDYVYNCTSCFHLIDGIYYLIDADNHNANMIKQSREGTKQNQRVCEYRMRTANIYTWTNYPWISIPTTEFTAQELQAMW